MKGKLKWFIKWKIIEFPREVKDYGFKYAFEKEFIDPWWYPLKYGVQNLIAFFPVVWQDRDWDYHYWIRLNIFKLRRMEKLLREHGNHVNAERDADNIRKAVLALERLEKDDYILDVNMWVDKKYGELHVDWLPQDIKGNPTDEKKAELFQADFKTKKWGELTDSEKKMSDFLRSKNYKHADYLKQQDIEYATKIINKYLFHWWD
jgi:hypothetical protein